MPETYSAPLTTQATAGVRGSRRGQQERRQGVRQDPLAGQGEAEVPLDDLQAGPVHGTAVQVVIGQSGGGEPFPDGGGHLGVTLGTAVRPAAVEVQVERAHQVLVVAGGEAGRDRLSLVPPLLQGEDVQPAPVDRSAAMAELALPAAVLDDVG